MTLKSKHYLGLASAILLGFVSTGGGVGSLGVLSLGTAAPPSTLGGFSMTPIGADPSALGSMVTSVGSISFDQAVMHDQIGNGWGTWSHGYADRKSTRLNSSHLVISYAVFCLKKKNQI